MKPVNLERPRPLKCPFLTVIINPGDDKRVGSYRPMDCMREECQIWDGKDCSLKRRRRPLKGIFGLLGLFGTPVTKRGHRM